MRFLTGHLNFILPLFFFYKTQINYLSQSMFYNNSWRTYFLDFWILASLRNLPRKLLVDTNFSQFYITQWKHNLEVPPLLINFCGTDVYGVFYWVHQDQQWSIFLRHRTGFFLLIHFQINESNTIPRNIIN